MALAELTLDERAGLRDRAEREVAAALNRALRNFLARVRRETLSGTSALTAAAEPERFGDLISEQTFLQSLGTFLGWWADEVDARVVESIRTEFARTYAAQRDGATITETSLDGVAEYIERVRDRLVRGLEPPIAEDAFDRVRMLVTRSSVEGWSRKQLSDRIAAELSWVKDESYWRAQKQSADDRLDEILDAHGPPGSVLRERARMHDPDVRALQAQRTEAIRALEADQSHWQTRADRIARTEATGANNYAALRALIDEGAIRKQWVATEDARTRLSHHLADGQVVAVQMPFTVGGVVMMFPGDPSAPPSQTVNCRCTIIGRHDDDDENTDQSAGTVAEPVQETTSDAFPYALNPEHASRVPPASPRRERDPLTASMRDPRDGDGDGWIDDGKPTMRPAPPKRVNLSKWVGKPAPTQPSRPSPPRDPIPDLFKDWRQRAIKRARDHEFAPAGSLTGAKPDWWDMPGYGAEAKIDDIARGNWGNLNTRELRAALGDDLVAEAELLQSKVPDVLERAAGERREYEKALARYESALRRHRENLVNWRTANGGRALSGMRYTADTHHSPEAAVDWGDRSFIGQLDDDSVSEAVRRYSGSASGSINSMLRDQHAGKNIAGPHADDVPILDAAMRPSPDDVIVTRSTDLSEFGLRGSGPQALSQMLELEGSVYSQPGYMSTTLTPSAAVTGDVIMRIKVPQGHPSLWVEPVSEWPGEYELLLGRGSRVYIHSVRIEGVKVYVEAEVIPNDVPVDELITEVDHAA